MQAVDSIVVRAPASKVFETVLDYGNHHRWWRLYSCKVLGGAKPEEGVRVSHRFGLSRIPPNLAFTRTIRRIVPNERIEETYDEGDCVGTGVWTFQEENGRTTVSFDCDVRSASLLSHVGIGLTGAVSHHAVYKIGLRGLKRFCESSNDNPPKPR